jgi:hypothetical protein
MQVFRRPANPMQWNRLFRNKAPGTDIWAALCEARADGSDPAHQSGVRYPLLVMVRSSEDELEGKVFSLLKTYGWQEPQVKRLKKVAQPFHSDDSMMQACYEGVMQRDGGIVVYSDPLEDD